MATFEDYRDFLLKHLQERWGDEPGWEFRPNKSYGYYLMYDFSKAPLGEVRKLIDDLFGFASGPTFILGDTRQT